MRTLRTIVVLGTCVACLSLASAGAALPSSPSCAEGPLTVGGTTLGTPCADTIVVPPGVETVRGGGGDDTILPGPISAAAESCPAGCFLGIGSQTYEGGPGDDDPSIDCGEDVDRALVDQPAYGDAPPVNCEAVREADPNSFQSLPGFPIPVPPPPLPTAAVVPPQDRKPPRTRIVRRPPDVIKTPARVRRVSVRFTADEPGASFRCRLDRRPYRPCVSPRAYRLTRGRHIIHIRAVDAAGNADRTPALVRVTIRRR